jgi:hypothetical protein
MEVKLNPIGHFESSIFFSLFFFFFFDMFAQEGEGRIRTSDLRFIRHGPSQLNYLLRTFLLCLCFSFLYFNIVLEFFIFIFLWALEAVDFLNRNFIFFNNTPSHVLSNLA